MIISLDKKALTLGIGDGTNDVPMIKAAHLGIGLKGVEGTEAASSSDYSMAGFRHIKRLMFYHGRGFAYRYTDYVTNFFWRTVTMSTIAIMLGFTNGFSGA